MNLGELAEKMKELDNWSLEGGSINKDFIFKDFKESLDFVNKVGGIAEMKMHHPDILIYYSRVRLSLTTHEKGQVTEKDIELAKEIDGLMNSNL